MSAGKTIKLVIIIIGVIAAVAGIYFYKEYNRKAADLTDAIPTEKVTATELVAAYDSDEAKANQKYLGKIIQVSGLIAEINNQQDTLITVSMGNADDMHKVNCLLEKTAFKDVKSYTTGKAIIVKGICTGFLIDVELNRCVIVADHK